MPFTCVLCKLKKKVNRKAFVLVSSFEVEEKIKAGYEKANGYSLEDPILCEHVHKECYWKYLHIASSVSKTVEVAVEMYSASSHSGVFVDRTNHQNQIPLNSTTTTVHPISTTAADQTSNTPGQPIDESLSSPTYSSFNSFSKSIARILREEEEDMSRCSSSVPDSPPAINDIEKVMLIKLKETQMCSKCHSIRL